jgi:hypothetical protein
VIGAFQFRGELSIQSGMKRREMKSKDASLLRKPSSTALRSAAHAPLTTGEWVGRQAQTACFVYVCPQLEMHAPEARY